MCYNKNVLSSINLRIIRKHFLRLQQNERIFYITCIDKPEKLEPFYHKYKDKYHVVYQKDIYTGEQWLEIMPQKASKAQAALQLKQKLACDRLVVFGDGKNDIDMFKIADEAYAVKMR